MNHQVPKIEIILIGFVIRRQLKIMSNYTLSPYFKAKEKK